MTREEMIAMLREYCVCVSPKDCPSCPIRKVPERGVGCEDLADRTDDELAACIEKITPVPVDAETTAQDCGKITEYKVLPVKHMVEISRDDLCAMRGRLLMLSCCSGVTITNAMADEILFMVETIEDVLKESEDILG